MTEKLKKVSFKSSHPDIKSRNEGALEKLKAVFSGLDSRYGKPLSKSTITNYVSKVNRLALEVTGKPFDGEYKWMLDPKNVIDCIDKSSLSSKKDFLSGVVRFLRQSGVKDEIIIKYHDGINKFKNAEAQIKDKGLATSKQVKNSLPLPDIIKLIKDFKVTDDSDLADKLIVQLYFQNSLVPRNELYLLKYVNQNKKPKDMSKDFNYITLDKFGVPINLIYNHYKSRNTYGINKIFPLSIEVRETFKEYVKRTNGKPGDFVFLMRSKDDKGDNKPFQESNFSSVIKAAMKKVLGVEITANLARSIQITDYYSKGLPSVLDQKKDSDRYLHSVNQHQSYSKVNLPDDNDSGEDT